AWRRARAADPDAVGDEDYFVALRSALTTSIDEDDFEVALDLRVALKALIEANPDLLEGDPATAEEVMNAISEDVFRLTRERYARTLQDRQKRNDPDLAMEVWRDLMRDYPEEDTYAYETGLLLLDLGRATEALEVLERYITAADGEQRIARLENLASSAEQKGVRGVAIEYYSRALSLMGSDPSLPRNAKLFKLAILYLVVNDEERARRTIRAYLDGTMAIDGTPLPARIDSDLADNARRAGRTELALELLEEAGAEAVPDKRNTMELAEMYARRAQQGDVERVLARYVERSADTFQAQVSVAEWAERRRNYEIAQFYFERIVDSPKAGKDEWLALAKIYAVQARTERLKKAASTYLELSGPDLKGFNNVFAIYSEQRLYEDAEKILERAQKRYPTERTIVERFDRLYEDWSKPDAAVRKWELWIKANGNRASDIAWVGKQLQRSRRFEQAIGFLRRAATDPRRPEIEAWLNIAQMYQQMHRDLDMKVALDAYLAASKDKLAALAKIEVQYASSALGEEHIKVLQQLIELQPENSAYRTKLGNKFMLQGRKAEAFEIWFASLAQAQDPLRELEQLASRLRQRQRAGWLLEFYQLLMERGDMGAKLYELIGDLYADRRAFARYSTRGFSGATEHEERKLAVFYYKRYLDEVPLSTSELSSFGIKMMTELNPTLPELAVVAFEKALERGDTVPSGAYMQYGRALLDLGEVARAQKALSTFHERQGRNARDTARIGKMFRDADLLAQAEPYFAQLMAERNNAAQIDVAFSALADIYMQTDRSEKLRELVNQYVAAAQSTGDARQKAADQLIQAGQWEVAVELLERLVSTQGLSAKFSLGKALYSAGQSERADSVLREWASDPAHDWRAWLKLADFYLSRAELERASGALDSAVNAAPGDIGPLLTRGMFRVEQGRFDDGMADFDRARKLARPDELAAVFKTQANVLSVQARFDLVREVSRDALDQLTAERDVFQRQLARFELATGDSKRAERIFDELGNAGVPFKELLGVMAEHGHFELLAQTIESEIMSGDYIASTEEMLRYADVFVFLGGIDYLMRVAQPLLDRPRDDVSLEYQLGFTLLERGRLEQGALYLSAALERGDERERSATRMILADVLLRLGSEADARGLFLEHLSQAQSFEQAGVIQYMALSYEGVGRTRDLRAIVDGLVRQPRYARGALSLKLDLMLDRGGVLDAVALLEALVAPQVDESSTRSLEIPRLGDDAARAFVEGIAVLAGRGYKREALELVQRLPLDVQVRDEVRRARMVLDVELQTGEADESIAALANSDGASASERADRLEIANILWVFGRHAEARRIAEAELERPGSQLPARAFQVLTRSAWVAGELELLEQYVERFIAAHPNKSKARRVVLDELEKFGLDERALTLRGEIAERRPSQPALLEATRAALRQGDVGAYRTWAERYWRTATDPRKEASLELGRMHMRAPRATLRPMFGPLFALQPTDYEHVYLRARMAFIEGDLDETRRLLRAHVERVERDPLAIEDLLRQIVDVERWYTEATHVVGPMLQDEDLTPRAALFMGIAWGEVGREARARELIERFTRWHVDEAWASTAVASALSGRFEQPRLAKAFAERAIELRPEGPQGYLERAIAKIALGEDEVDADLKRAMEAGVSMRVPLTLSPSDGRGSRINAVLRVVRAAIKADRPKLAATYARLLDDAPLRISSGQLLPSWAFLVGALAQAGAGEDGLELLAAVHPEWLSTGVTRHTLDTGLVQLYEDAGFAEQAAGVYDEQIQRERMVWAMRPEGFLRNTRFGLDFPASQLATLFNNLAYVFSTTNTQIERGLPMVRTAIALSDDRTPEYLDTLAWLYYRQGDFTGAQRELYSALRTLRTSSQDPYNSDPSSLAEVFD
ncbi:MAG: tetratricopeptide repeat protein, partial [Myxococcota bacterium]